jgi:hypothetical protein
MGPVRWAGINTISSLVIGIHLPKGDIAMLEILLNLILLAQGGDPKPMPTPDPGGGGGS